MISNRWKWFASAAALLLLAPLAARADDSGTRVTIRPAAGTALPDPEKIVSQLTTVTGDHEVRVSARRSPTGEELTIDLWGQTLDANDIAPTLKQAFPVLASAEITVGAADPKDKPKPDPELEREARSGAKVKVIRKVERNP